MWDDLFTPDDDLWIDSRKLEKQVNIVDNHKDVNIVYSNAASIDIEGSPLSDFPSVRKETEYEIISGENLLPGYGTKYFLCILTCMLRSDKLLNIFRESYHFDTEEYLCYYIASTEASIAFCYDNLVALRDAEHYREVMYNGKIIDFKAHYEYRIKQIVGIYMILTHLHPSTERKLNTYRAHNSLARHILDEAQRSKDMRLFLKTVALALFVFDKFNLYSAIKEEGLVWKPMYYAIRQKSSAIKKKLLLSK